jgi:hypothetical protein
VILGLNKQQDLIFLKTAPHPAARSLRRPLRPEMSRNPRVSRETWQRDLARAENREFAGVLEKGEPHGYVASREGTMAAFARSWRLE